MCAQTFSSVLLESPAMASSLPLVEVNINYVGKLSHAVPFDLTEKPALEVGLPSPSSGPNTFMSSVLQNSLTWVRLVL